ncbi:2OG-Fe(II) oxygenase [Sphingomonas sp.]|jgi:Rps23 Pro-64 3,4-dihydroxylase Tpa1-like proline 4-hydroxylase|uniref:2OG-Fe(II) oxygenase n=1 Tax=Sphingomonas sp. TaxID=28214 RepID=UPI002E0D6F7E|nr:2OG-Fe(II) oxygenase [Sphingomonas sp.]
MSGIRPDYQSSNEFECDAHDMKTSALSAFSALPPYWVIDAAFGADLAAQLVEFVLERETAFTEAMVGKNAARTVRKTIRSSRTMQDFGALRETLENRFRDVLPAALSRLRMAPFSLTGLSMELAAHGDGDFYHRHIDTFVAGTMSGADRVLTGVYYFHAIPRPFSGGELRLHSLHGPEQGGSHVDVEPQNDRLVLFPAWVPHEVRPTSCPDGGFAQSRFAINCWYLRESA